MTLELLYKLNDLVYVVLKEDDGMVRVNKGKIVEFAMSVEHGLHYYIDSMEEEFKEEELIPITRQDLLSIRIAKLLKEEE